MLILFIKGLYDVILGSYHLNEKLRRKNNVQIVIRYIKKFFAIWTNIIPKSNIKWRLYYKIQLNMKKWYSFYSAACYKKIDYLIKKMLIYDYSAICFSRASNSSRGFKTLLPAIAQSCSSHKIAFLNFDPKPKRLRR